MENHQALAHLLSETRTFAPPESLAAHAHIPTLQMYEDLYLDSIDHMDQFWLTQANRLDWFKKPTIGCEYTWDTEKKSLSTLGSKMVRSI